MLSRHQLRDFARVRALLRGAVSRGVLILRRRVLDALAGWQRRARQVTQVVAEDGRDDGPLGALAPVALALPHGSRRGRYPRDGAFCTSASPKPRGGVPYLSGLRSCASGNSSRPLDEDVLDSERSGGLDLESLAGPSSIRALLSGGLG